MTVYVPEWDLNCEVIGWVRQGEGVSWLDEEVVMGDDGLPLIPDNTDYVVFADVLNGGLCSFVPVEQITGEEDNYLHECKNGPRQEDQAAAETAGPHVSSRDL